MFLLVNYFVYCELYGEVLKSLLLSCNSFHKLQGDWIQAFSAKISGIVLVDKRYFLFTMVSKATSNYHELGYKPLDLVFLL